MPTYDYECAACGHKFDELQSFSDPVLTKCPKCKKKKLRRLFGTGAAVLFKGSGFYETDYRSESYKSGAKAEADAAKPASEKPAETKSDAKPATESKDTGSSKPAGKSGTSGKSKPTKKGD
jgi:putative FmdB family regulatory protein